MPDATAVPTPSTSRAARSRKTERTPSELEVLSQISEKLDRVVAVLAAQGRDKEKQIDILAAAGCDSAFIGMIVGMNSGSVRMALSRRRAKSAGAATDPAAIQEA